MFEVLRYNFVKNIKFLWQDLENYILELIPTLPQVGYLIVTLPQVNYLVVTLPQMSYLIVTLPQMSYLIPTLPQVSYLIVTLPCMSCVIAMLLQFSYIKPLAAVPINRPRDYQPWKNE